MRHSSTLVLPATAQAPAHVRDALRRTCAHLPPDMLDDVQLLSSELVDNAVQHSDSATVTITFASEGNSIHVAVTDQDGSRPGPQRVAHNSESGRGLGLVEVSQLPGGFDRSPTFPARWCGFDWEMSGSASGDDRRRPAAWRSPRSLPGVVVTGSPDGPTPTCVALRARTEASRRVTA